MTTWQVRRQTPEDDDWGVPMDEIVTLANKSDAANILMILGS